MSVVSRPFALRASFVVVASLTLSGCFLLPEEEPASAPSATLEAVPLDSPAPEPSSSDPAEDLSGSVETSPGEPSWCGPAVSSLVTILSLDSLTSPETLGTVPGEVKRLRAISELEGVPADLTDFFEDAADFGDLVVDRDGEGFRVALAGAALLSRTDSAENRAMEECPETYADGQSRL